MVMLRRVICSSWISIMNDSLCVLFINVNKRVTGKDGQDHLV